jgi:hypothetical protein
MSGSASAASAAVCPSASTSSTRAEAAKKLRKPRNQASPGATAAGVSSETAQPRARDAAAVPTAPGSGTGSASRSTRLAASSIIGK